MKKKVQTQKGESRVVTSSIRIRMLIFSTAFVLLFSLLFYNLSELQIRDYEKYQAEATNQQLLDTNIPATRGTIYDSNMKVLAQSATVWTVAIAPKEIKNEKNELIAKGLAEILEVDEAAVLKKLEDNTTRWHAIKRKVEKPLADKVRQFIIDNELDGIYLEQDSKRYYPYGDFGSTILGFTGNDNQGLYGIEAFYDDELTGVDGRIVSAKNALGYNMPYEYEAMYEAQDGYSLMLTMDETIQHFLEKELGMAVEEHDVKAKGVGIVMDVETGGILAMATMPDYDPNDPFTIQDEELAAVISAITDDDERKTALNNARSDQWRNKCVSDLYEPGSVFKIVTASAALDSGSSTLHDSFYCRGGVQVGPHFMKCAQTSGHGSESFALALINSCNPAFIQIGATMGAHTFFDYFRSFGLSEKTGIDLPGEALSQFYKEEELAAVQLASCSFGQSNKITPIQMITAVATAVNGGNLVTPHIASKLLDSNGNVVEDLEPQIRRQVVSQETSASICSILEENVANGHGGKAYVSGYKVGGKSGTSQKLDSGDKDARIASFVGFAPADDPKIAVLIVLDEPNSFSDYGGQLCAPVVGRIISETLPYLGIEPSYSTEELETIATAVPNTVTQSVAFAQSALQQRGFIAKTVGSGINVVRQFPNAGTSIPKGSVVILYTEDGLENNTVTVPSVVGYNAKSAQQIMAAAGLNIKCTGSATKSSGVLAQTQSVAAGEKVDMGTLITVEFYDGGILE